MSVSVETRGNGIEIGCVQPSIDCIDSLTHHSLTHSLTHFSFVLTLYYIILYYIRIPLGCTPQRPCPVVTHTLTTSLTHSLTECGAVWCDGPRVRLHCSYLWSQLQRLLQLPHSQSVVPLGRQNRQSHMPYQRRRFRAKVLQ